MSDILGNTDEVTTDENLDMDKEVQAGMEDDMDEDLDDEALDDGGVQAEDDEEEGDTM